jgi:predicted neutral ceramidase superfamily lipid hydrolase
MMDGAGAAGGGRFFLAHLFFLVVFIALVWALVVVLLRHRKGMGDRTVILLAVIPLVLIFTTAFLAPKHPMGHQAVNVVYDGLLIYNAWFFWTRGPSPLGWLYLVAVIGTALDFAMHFVIKIA